MTSDQHIYTPPKWLRIFTIVVGLSVMLLLGFMNIRTQEHLASRLADWDGFSYVVPIAVWLFSLLCTIVWAASPDGSVVHARALQSVKISVAFSEVMNLSEHIWAYVDAHDGLGLALLPTLIVGSLPTLIDFFVIEVIAFVCSHPAAVISEIVEAPAAVISEIVEPPTPPVSEIVEPPKPKPVPVILPPAPPAEPPVSENKPDPEGLLFADHQKKRQAVVNQIAWWIKEIREDPMGLDPKKVLRGPELLRRLPGIYTEKNLMNCRRDAFALLDGPEITIMTDTEWETA